MKKVNVFLVGARKSATTTLASILDSHQDISVASNKEPEFFDQSKKDRASKYLEYRKLFDWDKPYRVDASTLYSVYPHNKVDVAKAIFDYNPDAIILYIIRQPYARLKSHYAMAYERRFYRGTFVQAIDEHPIIVDSGMYYTQIKRYIDLFGDDKVMIMTTDELKNDKKELAKKIENQLSLNTPFTKDAFHLEKNVKAITKRLPASMDPFFDSTIYRSIRKIIPPSLTSFARKSLHRIVQRNYSDELTDLIKKRLDPLFDEEIRNINAIIEYDIRHWLSDDKN